MKLIKSEQEEIEQLKQLQNSDTPMMQADFLRLNFLKKKAIRNCCTNTACAGHEGTDEEKICPKCKSELHKDNSKLLKAADPLIKYMNEHCHPHMKIIVTTTSVELLEGVVGLHGIFTYLKD